MNLRHSLIALPLVIVALAGCTSQPHAHTTDPASDSVGSGHGKISGAEEVAEPPLALVSIDSTGKIGLLDLLNDEAEQVGEQQQPLALASDGRYGFITTANGIAVIDSGRWTWDHVDHFHYYRADFQPLGNLAGEGPATVTTSMLSTAGGTGIYFAGSGDAVLLDNSALAEGRLDEKFRVHVGSGIGVTAPLGDGALVSHGNQLIWHSADGSESDHAIACTEPKGSITTRAALIIGCAEGAVLANLGTGQNTDPSIEMLPYPADIAAPRAGEFQARKGRPSVAALAGDDGFWLLNTREQSWQFVASDTALTRVTAVDDAEGHVLALSADGRVQVYLASTGELVGSTDALLTEVTESTSLLVDDQRAYVNDPNAGLVHEIAYSGEVRVARTLETPTTPFWLMEVGR
ncbi:ABC transporter [Leucobacter sp. UT-8R-CII-1-4]|uniref:ABC transporter n=1 Tax=Leucobacter sp. UT-8R-CII-1-4 TaxID=3040075 RepID=UPI0024A8E864|nr:ABC transporter [Leucobacter sp. UT-8R-CII-1-4]MDI6022608.1 ABC transporter [Leucobacter sp. UT-8R-CII-1-4]